MSTSQTHTIRLHVARHIFGAHDWWNHGARLRDELRAIEKVTRVPSAMRDLRPQEVHAWAAAHFERDLVDCAEIADRWKRATEESLPAQAKVWSEVVLSDFDGPYLDDLPGFAGSTTLAVPLAGFSVPAPSNPDRLRLTWWSSFSELHHVSLSQAPLGEGLTVTVHERRTPLRGSDLETLTLDALRMDIQLPTSMRKSATLIDGATGATLTRLAADDTQGHPVTPIAGLRLIQT